MHFAMRFTKVIKGLAKRADALFESTAYRRQGTGVYWVNLQPVRCQMYVDL